MDIYLKTSIEATFLFSTLLAGVRSSTKILMSTSQIDALTRQGKLLTMRKVTYKESCPLLILAKIGL